MDLFDYDQGCECEIDLSCPLHANQIPFIDRQYQGLDEEEARAFGVYEREYQ